MNTEITKQIEASQTVELLPPEPDKRALNALRHGLTAEHVTPNEREGYLEHLAAMRASTGAQGYLEQRLADRAALALWRLGRVARFEAALSSTGQRDMLAQIEAGKHPSVRTAYERLSALTSELAETHRLHPRLSEECALRVEAEAALIEQAASGGRAEGLGRDGAAALGWALVELLEKIDTPHAQIVRAMLGRPPKRGEAGDLEARVWEMEPEEVPPLLELFKEQAGKLAATVLEGYASRERVKASKIREAQQTAEGATQDALALAALPRADALEKVTRYEAHLERVLYRALHDLEAARRERQGQETPPPLRGVLDEQAGT